MSELEESVEGHRADTKKAIEDVFKVVFDNRASILQKNNMTGDINDNVLSLLNDMERDITRKQDSAEATKVSKDLAKRLSQVEESLKAGAAGSVAPADIQRWNKAASKSQSLEESFDKMKAHIESLNLEQTRVDIQKTNSLVLTMTPRADFDPLARELQKTKNQLSDLLYEVQLLAKKLDSTNIELQSSRSNAKQELGLLEAKHEALDKSHNSLKKIVTRLSESGSPSTGGINPGTADFSGEDFEKLREDFEQYVESTEYSLKVMRANVDSKATMSDLASLQNNFNDRLSELLNNF